MKTGNQVCHSLSKEAYLATMVNMIANKHNVKLVIDWDNHVMDFTGDPPNGWTPLIDDLEELSKKMQEMP